MMKISIALCTCNGGLFLATQLSSFSSQKVKPFELVVCDDASTDNTCEIIDSFKMVSDFPVRIYKNNPKLGISRNYEKAISLCRGDIIALSDQDDVWKNDKLEKVISAFTNNPEIGYVFSDAELVDEHLIPLGRKLWSTIGFTGERIERFKCGEQFGILLRQNVVTGATMAFKASLKQMLLPIPNCSDMLHDGWIAVLSSALNARGFPIQEDLILYRQHSMQQVGANPFKRKSEFEVYYSFVKKMWNSRLDTFPPQVSSYQCLSDRLLVLKSNFNINTDNELKILREVDRGAFLKLLRGVLTRSR
jgi:glycosyltransferase involved in cell wall biosynthesis